MPDNLVVSTEANRTRSGSGLFRERHYRVLMVAPTSFFADYGCHVRILEETRVLQAMGHEVTVITYQNGDDVADLSIERTLPIPWRRDYEVGSSRHKIAFDLLLGLKGLQVGMGQRFDLIHAHLHEGALIGKILGKLFRIPLLFDFQGSLSAEMVDHGFLNQTSPFYQPVRRLEGWLNRTANCVLTSSLHAERLLIDSFGCSPERVQTLPDCVNSDLFRPATHYRAEELRELRERLGIPPGRRLIVYLGLLAEHQGVGHLLQAVARLRTRRDDCHLLLMGFPNLPLYQQQAIQLGIGDAVTTTGRVPYAEAPRHLALGDVAVAPKLSTTEGAGKILNYMAVGLPTVAFDTPVAREYLGHNGLYADRGDVESLAHVLDQVLYAGQEDGMVRTIGERLRSRAESRFSWARAGQQIVDTYDFISGKRDLAPISLRQRIAGQD